VGAWGCEEGWKARINIDKKFEKKTFSFLFQVQAHFFFKREQVPRAVQIVVL